MRGDFLRAVRDCSRARGDAEAGIAHARDVVHDQFPTYSVLHPWESPSTAFDRRRGFCVQYNTVLCSLLRTMGHDSWLVWAAKVRFDDNPGPTLGHAWVRVRLGDRTVDLCASSSGGRVGDVAFTPLTPPRRLPWGWTWPFSAASGLVAWGSVARAWVLRRPRPAWVEHPRRTGAFQGIA